VGTAEDAVIPECICRGSILNGFPPKACGNDVGAERLRCWFMVVIAAAFFSLPVPLRADQNSDKSSGMDISQLEEWAKKNGGGGGNLEDLAKKVGELGGGGNLEDLVKKAGELGGGGNLEDLAKKAGELNIGDLGDLAQKAGLIPPGPGGNSKEPSHETKKIDKESYTLQAGDKLNIKIFPEDPYLKGGEAQLSPDGNVTLPLMGKIPLAGKSVAEAQRLIQQILDRDYLVNPEVTIDVMETEKAERSFVFLGQVKKPGTYQLPAGEAQFTLLEAISLAGGFSDIANIKKIKILRQQGSTNVKKVLHANADAIISGHDPDIEINEGDVISVSETLF